MRKVLCLHGFLGLLITMLKPSLVHCFVSFFLFTISELLRFDYALKNI